MSPPPPACFVWCRNCRINTTTVAYSNEKPIRKKHHTLQGVSREHLHGRIQHQGKGAQQIDQVCNDRCRQHQQHSMPATNAEDVYIGQRKDRQPQREPQRRTGLCKMRAASAITIMSPWADAGIPVAFSSQTLCTLSISCRGKMIWLITTAGNVVPSNNISATCRRENGQHQAPGQARHARCAIKKDPAKLAGSFR